MTGSTRCAVLAEGLGYLEHDLPYRYGKMWLASKLDMQWLPGLVV